MRKILFIVGLALFAIMVQGQTKIATNSSGTVTFDLTPQEREDVLDSIATLLGYSGCNIDSVRIDDQDPATTDSASYFVFYADCHGQKFTFGLYLTKAQNHGDTEYYIDDDEFSVARAWKCDPDGECNDCRPVRNWFLGPVVDCDCDDCLFSTNGNGISAGDIINIIIIILNLL